MNLRASFAAIAFLACVLAAGGVSASDVRPFVRGSWKEILTAHATRPTIVHIWGPSCGPCLAELPEWGGFVATQKGVDFVLINGDRPQPRPAAAEQADARLHDAGLREAESWAFAESHVDRLRFEIDPNWQGELPYTMLIARDGHVTTFSGSADFTALGRWAEAQSR